jgi:hypothetical protein
MSNVPVRCQTSPGPDFEPARFRTISMNGSSGRWDARAFDTDDEDATAHLDAGRSRQVL